MRSIHHNTMNDAAAQKTHYESCSTAKCSGRREMWPGQKPWQYIEEAGRRASSVGVSHSPAGWDGVEKAFFKHLTGAECIVPCLRVISTRPLLCTGVITLHFTPPVILALLWLSVWTTWRLVIWLIEHDVLVHDRIYRKAESLMYEQCAHVPAFICRLYAGKKGTEEINRV